MTRRKPISQIVHKRLNYNLDDRDTIIALLLKRHCTHEQVVEYLLSAVLEQVKDDMLGELATWEANKGRRTS